jgi:hypothetical protein
MTETHDNVAAWAGIGSALVQPCNQKAVPASSEKPCLGCNGLSRIIGLQGIKIHYKPLAGRLISPLKPLLAVIWRVMCLLAGKRL